MNAERRIELVIEKLAGLSWEQLQKFQKHCLLADCQLGLSAASDEMSRRLRVAKAEECPHCGNTDADTVSDMSTGEGYCAKCQTPFVTDSFQPQDLIEA